VTELQNKIQALWYAERPRWILWVPVWVGIGVGWYFALENEPSLMPLLSGLGVLSVLGVAAWWRGRAALALLLCVACCVLAGLTAGTWRSQAMTAPILEKPLFPREVVGQVAEITTRPDSTRLTLEQVEIAYLPPERAPKYVTVSLREHLREGVELGDTVRLRAGFFPPPMPVIPGGYAFNRHFFFKQIGATGYTMGYVQPEIVQKGASRSTGAAWLAKQRHAIAQWLIDGMGIRLGAIASALMVGEQKAISDDIYEAMRQSGLVHVISISGLHLTLAAGIMFFSVRLLLAMIPAFALRYDGKKAAAILALASTFMYLLLAGAPISAQRSFVMVVLVLGAVLLSRNVTPIRSLCLAAFLLLIFTPESMLNPGFQLSFAATLGILAWHEYWSGRAHRTAPEEWTWQRKQMRFWGGVISTSAVATLATLPFILYHFEGLPVYSVLANLLVMPLVSLWIMPLVVLCLLLYPLGIGDWVLPLLKAGLYVMVRAAEWVVSLPYAIIDLPPLSTPAITAIALGGLWLCLWQTRWRLLGMLAVVMGAMSLLFYAPPDMVISADGKKIAVRSAPDAVTMLRGQRTGFTQDGWKRFMRVEAFRLRSETDETRVHCDRLGCIYRWNGQEAAVSYHRATLAEDCALSDVVITPDWSSYRDHGADCAAQIYDRGWFAKTRGAAFWITPEGFRIRTVAETLGNRPWSGR
jgi:competence protein ComEC